MKLYENFFKRFIDFCLSFVGFIVLSPLLLVLSIIGAIAMKGNPFFCQPRPGKNEKVFKILFNDRTNIDDTGCLQQIAGRSTDALGYSWGNRPIWKQE